VSLRARIRLLAVGAAAAVLLLCAVPVWFLEVRTVSDDVTRTATDAARSVADYLSASQPDEGGSASRDLAAYVDRANARDDATPVSVVTADGIVHGGELPRMAAHLSSPSGDELGGDADGDAGSDGPFLAQSDVDADEVPGGTLVGLTVRSQEGPTRVFAFASDDRVNAEVATRLAPLGLAATALLLVVAGAAEALSRRLARDISRTAEVADALSAGDMGARVPESGPPEVRRVAMALNGLAERIDELLVAERETVADLSHRLRTPLMALRLDVESLPDGSARTELDEHVTGLERSLTAVIHQARRTAREGARVGCLPGPVVAETVEYWRPLIEDQVRPLDVQVDPDLPEVHCSAEDLRAALDALVENGIAHTPDGTPMRIIASHRPGASTVAVAVHDRGPGFDRTSVTRGRSDRGSSGLGLDIALQTARAAGGDLAVDRQHDPAGGPGWTIVTLTLGVVARRDAT
jgi:signal transduction histidine kinase